MSNCPTGGGAVAASSSKGRAAGKPSKAKVKSEEKSTGGGGAEEEGAVEETDYSKAKRALATAEPAAKEKKKRTAKVDSHVPLASSYQVEGDWDCMLNQTNIGHNNNKYYVIQMLKRQSLFHAT